MEKPLADKTYRLVTVLAAILFVWNMEIEAKGVSATGTSTEYFRVFFVKVFRFMALGRL